MEGGVGSGDEAGDERNAERDEGGESGDERRKQKKRRTNIKNEIQDDTKDERGTRNTTLREETKNEKRNRTSNARKGEVGTKTEGGGTKTKRNERTNHRAGDDGNPLRGLAPTANACSENHIYEEDRFFQPFSFDATGGRIGNGMPVFSFTRTAPDPGPYSFLRWLLGNASPRFDSPLSKAGLGPIDRRSAVNRIQVVGNTPSTAPLVACWWG